MKSILCAVALLLSVSAFAQSKVTNFTRLEMDGPLIVELVSAETPGIVATQSPDLVRWEVNGDALVVMARFKEGQETAKVQIQVTDLQALETTGAVIINGKGTFATRKMALQIGGQSIVTLAIDVEALAAKVNRQSILTLSGTADTMTLAADEQSVADISAVKSSALTIDADHQSVVTIQRGEGKVSVNTAHQSVVVE